MEHLIESIRAATATDASAAAKTAGIDACQAIVAALEAKPGESLAAGAPPGVAAWQAVASALRGMPPDQLLDLAISRLRAALPACADVAPVQPLKLHLLPLPLPLVPINT